MKAQATRIFILALALILIAASLGPVGGTTAQAKPAATGENIPSRSPDAPSVGITPTMSYQGRLVENGAPVTGTRSMTFRLWDKQTGGSWYWEEGPKPVSVSNGLFTVTLGDTNPFNVSIFKMQLYLEVNVAGTVLPRQMLQGAPYALSLAPGAEMSGDQSWSLLYAFNGGGGEGLVGDSIWGNGVGGYSNYGHGMYAQSDGNYMSGAALYAKNTNTDGIAFVAQNNSTSDATMILENDGSGDLLKGFGGDSGEDEFRFKNDGTFQDKAPSYVFVPGANLITSYTYTQFTIDQYEYIAQVQSSALVEEPVCIPVTLPAVLYGQPVKLESIKIYYSTSGTNYITSTFVELYDLTTWYPPVILTDPTDRASSGAISSYVITPGTLLSQDNGALTVCWWLHFSAIGHPIYIFGMRLTLRHHPLY